MKGTPKPGEWWRLANGKRALIYAVHTQDSFPIHGAVAEPGGTMSASAWGPDGEGMFGIGTNLVSRIDWRDELAPIWLALKPEWRFVAMDRDDGWFAYKSRPSIDGDDWLNQGPASLHLYMLAMPNPTCHWYETLTERPEE